MPYANVQRKTSQPGPDAGVRVQWTDATVTLTVLPMTGGEPSEVDRQSQDFLWASLDRQTINELIRKLREARDKAWGADA